MAKEELKNLEDEILQLKKEREDLIDQVKILKNNILSQNNNIIFFEKLFNSNLVAIAKVDLNGVLLNVNSAFCTFFEYPKNELVNKYIHNLFYKNQLNKTDLLVEELKKKEIHSILVEKKYITVNGKIKNCEINLESIFNEDGEIIYFIFQLQDITEPKKIINKYSDSEKRFKALSNASFEAVFISENGFYIDVNKAATELFGYSYKELKGKFGPEIFSEETRELVKKNTLTGYEEPYEAIGIKKNGDLFNVEIRGKMFEYMGKQVRVAAVRDITERKIALKTIQDNEEKYRNLFENSPDPILIHNNGIVISANKATLDFLGAKSLDEVLGLNAINFVHPDYKQLAIDRIKRIAQNNEFLGLVEEKFITLQNKVCDVEITAVPFKYKDTIVNQVVFRDITERKKIQNALVDNENKLKELNSTKDKFFSIIAHDLKNPFNQLIGFTNLLLSNIRDYTLNEIEEYLTLLNKSAKNGYSLLENLLEWSRTQTGKKQVILQEIYLKDVIYKNIELFSANAKSKNISLLAKVPNNLFINADYNMIMTVFRNLISNALKFTNRNGTVKIEAVQNNKFVKISIIDNGVGISEDEKNKLFRIDINHSTRGTENESGTGLGLILSKEFIELNGGTISVESELGKGTTFYFTLQINEI